MLFLLLLTWLFILYTLEYWNIFGFFLYYAKSLCAQLNHNNGECSEIGWFSVVWLKFGNVHSLERLKHSILVDGFVSLLFVHQRRIHYPIAILSHQWVNENFFFFDQIHKILFLKRWACFAFSFSLIYSNHHKPYHLDSFPLTTHLKWSNGTSDSFRLISEWCTKLKHHLMVFTLTNSHLSKRIWWLMIRLSCSVFSIVSHSKISEPHSNTHTHSIQYTAHNAFNYSEHELCINNAFYLNV